MSTALQIKPELQVEIESLARMTHRDSAELVNEALEAYLEADHRYRKIVTERIDQAKRGEFASDEEVEAFFAKHPAPE